MHAGSGANTVATPGQRPNRPQRSLGRRVVDFLEDRFLATREWLAEPQAVASALRYRLTRNALPFTVQTIKGLPPQPPAGRTRLVLFAHYDPQDEVDEYVRFYLERLSACGCAIVFVSGSPNLKAASAEKIRPFCAGIFTQQTRSLDFGSWNLAWQQVRSNGWKLESFEQFVLANDSVYGPLFPLTEMLDAFTGADMYGMTESNERGNHLQSFFLAWELNKRTRAFLDTFWSNFRYVVRKQRLIDKYETGISRMARRAGLTLKSYVSDQQVRQAFLHNHPNHQHAERIQAGPVNNTLLLWDILLEDFRCPLLKTDLPRRNRFGSLKIANLSGELKQWTDYDPELITRHIARIGSNDPSSSVSNERATEQVPQDRG